MRIRIRDGLLVLGIGAMLVAGCSRRKVKAPEPPAPIVKTVDDVTYEMTYVECRSNNVTVATVDRVDKGKYRAFMEETPSDTHLRIVDNYDGTGIMSIGVEDGEISYLRKNGDFFANIGSKDCDGWFVPEEKCEEVKTDADTAMKKLDLYQNELLGDLCPNTKPVDLNDL